jgi:hypothetical protein
MLGRKDNLISQLFKNGTTVNKKRENMRKGLELTVCLRIFNGA